MSRIMDGQVIDQNYLTVPARMIGYLLSKEARRNEFFSPSNSTSTRKHVEWQQVP